MRLRTQWQNIMSDDGMPFVQTSAPLKVFEKHIKELADLGITDDDIVESWRKFAVDARRGVLPRNKHPWFSYWGRRSKYLPQRQVEATEADWTPDEGTWG